MASLGSLDSVSSTWLPPAAIIPSAFWPRGRQQIDVGHCIKHRRVTLLRMQHSQGAIPSASEALAGAGETGWNGPGFLKSFPSS